MLLFFYLFLEPQTHLVMLLLDRQNVLFEIALGSFSFRISFFLGKKKNKIYNSYPTFSKIRVTVDLLGNDGLHSVLGPH